MVSPEESRLNETQWQQHHCCFPHGSLKLMNLAVDHFLSSKCISVLPIYVGSATTGGPLFLLKQSEHCQEDGANILENPAAVFHFR